MVRVKWLAVRAKALVQGVDWFFRIDERGAFVKGAAGRLGVPFATAHVCYRRLG